MNDQNIIPLFVAGSLALTVFGLFLIAYMLVQKKTQVSHELEKKKIAFDHENNILRVKIEENEHAMDQISKELHDSVKSLLGFAQFNMYRISDLADNDSQLELIEKTNKILGDVIHAVHNISHSLNANYIKNIGLIDMITEELEYFSLAKGISTNIVITGESFSLESEKELHIFRIVQEAIQNCAKHSNAASVTITLEYDSPKFKLTVRDNGVGFDKNKVHELNGLGFLNMFQRARFVHGSFEVQSQLSEGTTIILSINEADYGRDHTDSSS